VSVVIPTHNRPVLMKRAADSVLAQDYGGPIEVVVVFDAAEPFDLPDPQRPGRSVRSIVNTRTRGLAGARNSGIVAASHGLVGFLDDDDEWLPEKLAEQVPVLLGSPDAPLAGAGMQVITTDDVVERPIPMDPVTLSDLLRDRITQLNACGILARREALLGQLGLVDEQIPGSYGEDYDLLLRAARIAPIPVVVRPVVKVHWHGGSYFNTRWQMIIDALEYLLAKHPDFRSEPVGYARMAGQIAFAYASLGESGRARHWAWQAMRSDPRQPRTVLALAVAAHLVRPERVLAALNKRGRGI
jgi:glycosyltransferase involved in cell wall biosynthesis